MFGKTFFCLLAAHLVLLFVRAQDTTPTSTTSNQDCSAPCPPASSDFCVGMRDENCICKDVCCSKPVCEFGYEVCTSCDNCICADSSTTVPTSPCYITCNDRDGCQTSVNYESCQCEYECYTTSTISPCATTCERRPYCAVQVNPNTCLCEYSCTTPRETTSTTTTDSTTTTGSTTSTPCNVRCSDKFGCTKSLMLNTCTCEYDCSNPVTAILKKFADDIAKIFEALKASLKKRS